MVERAIKLPGQLALRFFDEHMDLAVRIDDARLSEGGLDAFTTDEWGA